MLNNTTKHFTAHYIDVPAAFPSNHALNVTRFLAAQYRLLLLRYTFWCRSSREDPRRESVLEPVKQLAKIDD
jgi:hypothetical protein